MSTVFEAIREEGRAEEIVELGFEFGLLESEILEKLQHKLNISLQEAQAYLKKFNMAVI